MFYSVPVVDSLGIFIILWNILVYKWLQVLLSLRHASFSSCISWEQEFSKLHLKLFCCYGSSCRVLIANYFVNVHFQTHLLCDFAKLRFFFVNLFVLFHRLFHNPAASFAFFWRLKSSYFFRNSSVFSHLFIF